MPMITTNKRAYFDYNILETFEAGLELKGFEAKSIKNGRINLAGSYAIIRQNEAWLINADIPAYQPKNAPIDYDSKRNRKLLLRKSEIKNLIGKVAEKGLTLVPLKIYTKNRLIKIDIGLGKSRKKTDKRELIKKRDIEAKIREKLRE
ncbi:MAG: SsrA-binding protein SmpB [Patescibacteria group bacterium]